MGDVYKRQVYMSDSILDQVIQHPEVIYTLAQELVCLVYTSDVYKRQAQGGRRSSYRASSFPIKYPIEAIVARRRRFVHAFRAAVYPWDSPSYLSLIHI